ncbi:hypothetical protein DL771_002942 [Monosporascus sp. 5C6A]|nr:hypothetical protein DL771_002942 [Monosporascus sp. 5C6A]
MPHGFKALAIISTPSPWGRALISTFNDFPSLDTEYKDHDVESPKRFEWGAHRRANHVALTASMETQIAVYSDNGKYYDWTTVTTSAIAMLAPANA